MVYLQSPKQPMFFSLLICFCVDVYEFWCDSGQKKSSAKHNNIQSRKRLIDVETLLKQPANFLPCPQWNPKVCVLVNCFSFHDPMKKHSVGGSEIRLTSWYGKYPIIYRVSYMSGGCLGFLPSTVSSRMFPGDMPTDVAYCWGLGQDNFWLKSRLENTKKHTKSMDALKTQELYNCVLLNMCIWLNQTILLDFPMFSLSTRQI